MGTKAGLLLIIMLLLPQAELKTIKGKVTVVRDGDTLTVKTIRDRLYRVRLADIDAPEKGQSFGRPARRLATDLALKKIVLVNYTFKDKYGSLIGEVLLPNGKILNEEMLKSGLAWHYRVKHPYSSFLENLEFIAWEKKLGLWVQEAPIPPWEFRREKKIPTPPSRREDMDYDLFWAYGLVGNPKTRIYEWPECNGYPKNTKGYLNFGNFIQAESLGYRASKRCKRN
jgi:micrococcal nuclease